MEWLKSLFRKPEPVSQVKIPTPPSPPVHNPARERAVVLSQTEWVNEQLSQCPVERLLEVSGLREAHINTLRHAKITNLREARECTSLPLLGATADWVTSWLRNFVSRLEREYHQHRQAMDKAA